MAKKDEKPETQIVKDDAPKALTIFDYGDDAGKGYEHQGKADVSMPFINELQALSPIVTAEKAKPGDFFNTVSERIYPREQGFLFVPATTRHAYAEWVPRDTPGAGGYKGRHEVESEIVQRAIKNSVKFGKYKTDEGNNLVETFYVHGVLCDENGEPETMCVIPMWSTKIKPYQRWMTMLRNITLKLDSGKIVRPPLYGNLCRMTSKMTENAEKKIYYIPQIAPGRGKDFREALLSPDSEAFAMAKACMQLMDSGEGEKKIDYSQQEKGVGNVGRDDADDPGKPPF
jgi:hypothetical protein